MKFELQQKQLLVFIILFISTLNGVAQQNDTLVLKMLIESSLEHSQSVKIMQAKEQSALYDKRIASMTYLPTISLGASYTRLNDDIRLPSDMENLLIGSQALLIKEALGLPFSMPLPQEIPLTAVPPLQKKDIFKANISGQMVLFSGLKIPWARKASEHAAKASKLLTEQESATVIKNVVETFDKLAVVAKSAKTLNSTELYLNEQERFVLKAFKNGLATELDLKKIELAKLKLEAKQIELNEARELLIARLHQLSSVDIQTLTAITPTLELFPLTVTSFNVSARKDLQALEEAIVATDYKRKIAYSEYLPKIVAFGKKELITEDLSTFDPEWYVGIGVKWTIFDGLNARNTAQKAKLERVVLENKKAQATELLELNLTKMKLNLSKNSQLAFVAKKQEEVSQKAFYLSKKQYENGLITLNDFLSSVLDLEKAKLENIQAIYQQRASVISLYEASGKLYDSALQLLNITK